MLEIKFDESWEHRIMRKEKLSKEELSEKEKDFKEFALEAMRSLANNMYSEVKFYSCRKARVSDGIFDAERKSMRPLEYMLAIKAGVCPDNHIVYEVHNDCDTFYVWCTDDVCRVGKKLVEGSY